VVAAVTYSQSRCLTDQRQRDKPSHSNIIVLGKKQLTACQQH